MSQRGSAYILVLGACLVVTVLGVSALLAARVQHRQMRLSADTTHAHYAAQSALDAAILAVARNANWRSAYSHDTWTAAYDVGAGEYRFKFVDELDGDLDDDPTDPVRVFGRGVAGDAVRTISFELRDTPTTKATNLLMNNGFEFGDYLWEPQGGADLQAHDKDPHSGAVFLKVKSRDYVWSSAYQDVTTKLVSGTTYTTSAWVRLKDTADNVTIVLYVRSGDGEDEDDDEQWFWTAWTAVTTSWSKVTGTLTPTWNGSLLEARWYVCTQNTTQEMRLDDVELRLADPAANMSVTPGSTRLEVN